MSVITSNEIYVKLRSIFTDLPDIEIDDSEFVCVDKGWIAQYIQNYPPVFFLEGKWECEEIASAFVIDVFKGDVAGRNTLSVTTHSVMGRMLWEEMPII